MNNKILIPKKHNLNKNRLNNNSNSNLMKMILVFENKKTDPPLKLIDLILNICVVVTTF
jgi:hypothetical protein